MVRITRLNGKPQFPTKKGFARIVTKSAWSILKASKEGAITLIPFRLLSRLPNQEAVLRPVDSDRVNYMSSGMEICGFRPNEPCCANDPIPELGIRRYILGGNHRVASTRACGKVLVPTCRVSEEKLRFLMSQIRDEDDALIENGLLSARRTDREYALLSIEILSVTLQGLEPAPKPLSCLQQVNLLRTATKNDLLLTNFETTMARSYGGNGTLPERIFPNHPGTKDSSVHFLLNRSMGERHKNKLIAGAKVLMKTTFPAQGPNCALKKSLLDILVEWEASNLMGPFLETHLSYIGPLDNVVIWAIMENTREEIESGNYNTCPFNTAAIKLHMGALSGSKGGNVSGKRPGKRTFNQLAKRKRDQTKKAKTVSEQETSFSSTNSGPKSEKSTTMREKEEPTEIEDSKTQDFGEDKIPRCDSVIIDASGSAKTEIAENSCKRITPLVHAQRDSSADSIPLQLPINGARNGAREAIKKDGPNNTAKRLSKKKERIEVMPSPIGGEEREKGKEAEKSGSIDRHGENKGIHDVHFSEHSKYQELTSLKEQIAADIEKKNRDILLHFKNENASLRRELDELKNDRTTRPHFSVAPNTEKLKSLEEENKNLRLQLRKFNETDRPLRATIPSDKVVMKWSKEVLETMKKRVERQLQLLK